MLLLVRSGLRVGASIALALLGWFVADRVLVDLRHRPGTQIVVTVAPPDAPIVVAAGTRPLQHGSDEPSDPTPHGMSLVDGLSSDRYASRDVTPPTPWRPGSAGAHLLLGESYDAFFGTHEWKLISPPIESGDVKTRAAKKAGERAVRLSLARSWLRTNDGLAPPPWEESAFQLVGVAVHKLTSPVLKGREFPVDASPGETLKWHERLRGRVLATGDRETLRGAAERFESRRKELIAQIAARAVSVARTKSPEEPSGLVLQRGFLRVVRVGASPRLSEALAAYEQETQVKLAEACAALVNEFR